MTYTHSLTSTYHTLARIRTPTQRSAVTMPLPTKPTQDIPDVAEEPDTSAIDHTLDMSTPQPQRHADSSIVRAPVSCDAYKNG